MLIDSPGCQIYMSASSKIIMRIMMKIIIIIIIMIIIIIIITIIKVIRVVIITNRQLNNILSDLIIHMNPFYIDIG